MRGDGNQGEDATGGFQGTDRGVTASLSPGRSVRPGRVEDDEVKYGGGGHEFVPEGLYRAVQVITPIRDKTVKGGRRGWGWDLVKLGRDIIILGDSGEAERAGIVLPQCIQRNSHGS